MNRFISDDVYPAVLSAFEKVVELKVHCRVSDHEKHVLLMQHFILSPHCKFPTHVFMDANIIFSTVGCLFVMA